MLADGAVCDAELVRMTAELLGRGARTQRLLEEARAIAQRQGSIPLLERVEATAARLS